MFRCIRFARNRTGAMFLAVVEKESLMSNVNVSTTYIKKSESFIIHSDNLETAKRAYSKIASNQHLIWRINKVKKVVFFADLSSLRGVGVSALIDNVKNGIVVAYYGGNAVLSAKVGNALADCTVIEL